MNSLFRQQQAANQKARQDAKASKLSVVTGMFGAVAGPALGGLGTKLSEAVGLGGGATPSLSQAMLNNIPRRVVPFQQQNQQAFSNFYGGGNFLGQGGISPYGS